MQYSGTPRAGPTRFTSPLAAQSDLLAGARLDPAAEPVLLVAQVGHDSTSSEDQQTAQIRIARLRDAAQSGLATTAELSRPQFMFLPSAIYAADEGQGSADIACDDLALAAAAVLAGTESGKNTYTLSGSQSLTKVVIAQQVSAAINRPIEVVQVP